MALCSALEGIKSLSELIEQFEAAHESSSRICRTVEEDEVTGPRQLAGVALTSNDPELIQLAVFRSPPRLPVPYGRYSRNSTESGA